MAVGSQGRVVTSVDGVNWTIVDGAGAPDPWSFTGVTYGNGLFVASARYYGWQPSEVLTSKDGASVAYGGGRFVAVGDHGTILTSRDGIHWAEESAGTDQGLWDVAYAEGRFVIIGYTGTIISAAVPGE